MAQNITLLGASYSDVPAVTLPKTGGGTAKFTDVTPTTASASDVAQGKIFFDASGNQKTGTASGGGGESKNAQAHQSTTRSTSSSYTSVNSFTCNKTGIYDIYWSCMRSSTSGTWGSQLYIGGTAYGSAHTSSWSNHVQNITVTGVQIDQGDTVDVRVRSRGSNYYGYCPLVTIIEKE
mgnify:CR=1 FL=1